MPGFQISNGEVAQCIIRGELYRQQTRNVLYFRFDDVNPNPVSVAVSKLQDSLVLNFFPLLAGAQSAEYEVVQVDYRLLSVAFPQIWNIAFTSPGLLAAQSLPPSVTANTKRQVGLIGRVNRQRNYWPGVSEAQHSEGQLTAVGITAWNNVAQRLVQEFPTDIVGQTFTPVLTGIGPGGGPTSIRDLFIATVDPVLRSQRRREIGVGI